MDIMSGQSGRVLLIRLLPNIPELPGIYKMLSDKEILYIGKAKNLFKRLSYYTKNDLPIRLARMVHLIKNVEFIVASSEAKALLLEANLIKQLRPKFNILLKDDKSFPYLKITKEHPFAQITKHRGRNSHSEEYYGPFASTVSLENTIKTLQKIFKLRSCTDYYFASRHRPCLQYQIGNCSAPCVNKISKDDYSELVKQSKLFLTGKTTKLQKILATQMDLYSKEMKYEQAAEIRDRIKAITIIQQQASTNNIGDADVIGIAEKSGNFCIQVFFYRNGQNYGNRVYFPLHTSYSENNEVLESFVSQFYQSHTPPTKLIISLALKEQELLQKALFELHRVETKIIVANNQHNLTLINNANQNASLALQQKLQTTINQNNNLLKIVELFDLTEIPQRIEIYDNSHIMGKYAVGVMVVATPEGFDKNEYRRFTIKDIDHKLHGGDDYKMLHEVITRRLKKLEGNSQCKPDLMIIDGGKGHLNVVLKILELNNHTNIKVVSMSKGKQRNAGKEVFHMKDKEFTLPSTDEAMKYLQVLRDEAHNFAINSYRQKHKKSLYVSSLNDIVGIGKIRKQALLNHFGSFDSIYQADIATLTRVAKIGDSMARHIYNSLHKDQSNK